MSVKVGVPRETRAGETRVAITPDSVKKLRKLGFDIVIEKGAGASAHFSDEDYRAVDGVTIADNKNAAYACPVVLKIHRPLDEELSTMRPQTLLMGLFEPFRDDDFFSKAASAKIDVVSLELIPRTSRAQSMDALSSQANIAGYRAVIEGARQFGRFMGMMMTSAGMSKPAKVVVLGAGVAGLQAIATAKRLGAQVEAFDVRPEVKEQIESLGAKFIDLQLGETGSGHGGYAKELSEDAKRRQQVALTEKLKKADMVISTANIPGKKAPILITEEAVVGMRTGSVIVDMAAANGGNCPLTQAGATTTKHGVILIGETNFPGLMPTDSSQYLGNNFVNLLTLFVRKTESGTSEIHCNLEDDIVAASLVTQQGKLRVSKKAA